MLRWCAILVLAAACPTSGGLLHGATMSLDHDNDWLVVTSGTSRDLYERYYRAGPDRADRARGAMTDARPEVRRNAIVVITAAIAKAGMADYIAALDDADPFVVSEAAATLATYGPQSLSGPEDPAAMAGLRAHAEAIRAALRSPNVTARYNAATALLAIVDPIIPLATLFADETTLVRSVGIQLAGRRQLGSDDVAALEQMATHDPDRLMRVRAVDVVADRAPTAAEPILVAALTRGDVDRTTSDIVTERRMTSLVPAIIAHVKTHPESDYFIDTLADLGALCAAAVIADPQGVWGAGATVDALRKLSGHPEWSLEDLRVWGLAQPTNKAPCR